MGVGVSHNNKVKVDEKNDNNKSFDYMFSLVIHKYKDLNNIYTMFLNKGYND